MADSKISALTAVTSIDGAEEFAVNDGGTTKKATGTQISQYVETRYQQGVLCKPSTDQTVTTGGWAPVALGSEVWKIGDSSIHSTSTNNSRLTAQIDGEYLVTGVLAYDAIAASFHVRAQIEKNGATSLWVVTIPSSNDATWNSIIQITAVVQLTASDYIELEAYHDRGSNLDVIASATKFGMYLIGR